LWESPFDFPLFHRLSREIDTMFDRFGMERPAFARTASPWSPEMEVFAKDNEFAIKLDVPGLKKEDITVEVADDHLVLRGERKHEKEEKKEGYFKTERSYGAFYRSVPLPDGVKPEEAKATLSDGVLTIAMPIAKVVEKARKLEIGEPPEAKATKAA
jgi:HSP20 family protein